MKTRNRKKLFLDNFLIYGIGGIISKAIPLIMVPIITSLMPNSSYYGISDLTNTIINFFEAIAIFGMYDAMYRAFFEKKDLEYQKSICSSALAFTLLLSLICALLMIALRKYISQLFYSDPQYGTLVMIASISVLIGSTNSIISAPTRMQNKRGTYLLMNTLSPLISYGISIPLLLNGYYLIALPIATASSSIISEAIFAILNKNWFSFKRIKLGYIKDMLKIAAPLAPNALIYWVFNSSDRVMITHMLGTSEAGVYAVASKFGHLSQLIYTAFAGGWQYFAFSIMKDNDREKVISKVFELLLIASLVTTLLGSSIAKYGVEILFKEEYWSCYTCIPYLYLSPLLLMLFEIGSDQFLVIKKTWPNLIILSTGAVINIALNFVLIKFIGIEGASLATFIGYFVSIAIMVFSLSKLNLMHIRKKTLIYIAVFLIFFIIMRANNLSTWYINIPLALLFSVLTFFFYWKDYKRYFRRNKNKRIIELTKGIDLRK